MVFRAPKPSSNYQGPYIVAPKVCVLEIVAHLPPVREHQRRQEVPTPFDKPKMEDLGLGVSELRVWGIWGLGY